MGQEDFGQEDFGQEDFGQEDLGQENLGQENFGTGRFGTVRFGTGGFGTGRFWTGRFGDRKITGKEDFLAEKKFGGEDVYFRIFIGFRIPETVSGVGSDVRKLLGEV